MRKIESTRQRLLTVSLLMVVIALFMGCDRNPVSGPGDQLTIYGKVVGDNTADTGAGIQGATVSAARIRPDGSLAVIDREQTVTDATGNFSTTVESGGSQSMVLIAQKDTAEWEALLPDPAEVGQPDIQSVVNFESTAEAAVYRQIVKIGRQSGISLSLLREYIGPEEARLIRRSHNELVRFTRLFLEHAHARARTSIKAIVYDSTSSVQIRNNFLVGATDDSSLVDSVIARFQMDPVTVDSLLVIRPADHEADDGHMEAESHREHEYEKEDSAAHHTFLLVKTYPHDPMQDADTGFVAVRVMYKFSTDSTTRADLVAAIAERSHLTRTQVVRAMQHRRDDQEAHEWDDDHGDDPGDDEHEAHAYAGVDTEIHGNITLTRATRELVDSLTAVLQTDSLPAETTGLALKVQKENGDVTVSQELNLALPGDGMDLWNAILAAVKSEVTDAAASDAYVQIEWKLDGCNTTMPVPLPSGV